MPRRKLCGAHGMQANPCPVCIEIEALARRAETAEALLAWAQESRLRWRADSEHMRGSLRSGFVPKHPPPPEVVPDALVTTEERRAAAIAAKRLELVAAQHELLRSAESAAYAEEMDDLCGLNSRTNSFDNYDRTRREECDRRAAMARIEILRTELTALGGSNG